MRKRASQLDREIAEALKSRKSPLRVACRTLAFGIKSCTWKVVGEMRGAQFASRTRPDEFAIVHPSTKHPGKWQVSFFDAAGPVGDSQHSRVEDALEQVSPKKWRLREF